MGLLSDVRRPRTDLGVVPTERVPPPPPQVPASATVRAVTPCKLLLVPKQRFARLLHLVPDFEERVKNMAKARKEADEHRRKMEEQALLERDPSPGSRSGSPVKSPTLVRRRAPSSSSFRAATSSFLDKSASGAPSAASPVDTSPVSTRPEDDEKEDVLTVAERRDVELVQDIVARSNKRAADLWKVARQNHESREQKGRLR